MDIIVDANGPDEQAMGWYYYLEEKLHFPFTAICCEKRVRVSFDTIEWDSGIDLDPEFIYEKCQQTISQEG